MHEVTKAVYREVTMFLLYLIVSFVFIGVLNACNFSRKWKSAIIEFSEVSPTSNVVSGRGQSEAFHDASYFMWKCCIYRYMDSYVGYFES